MKTIINVQLLEVPVTTSGGVISSSVTMNGVTADMGTANYTVDGNKMQLSNPLFNGVVAGTFAGYTAVQNVNDGWLYKTSYAPGEHPYDPDLIGSWSGGLTFNAGGTGMFQDGQAGNKSITWGTSNGILTVKGYTYAGPFGGDPPYTVTCSYVIIGNTLYLSGGTHPLGSTYTKQ